MSAPADDDPFIWNVAGVWLLDFDVIELMIAMSSTQPARCGRRSLIHAPLWPRWRKANWLCISLPG